MAQGTAHITLTGNQGKPAEIQVSAKGTPYVKFSLAVQTKTFDGTDVTTWYNVVAFQQLAERIEKRLSKGGARLLVIGTYLPREYEHKGKHGVSHDVAALSVDFLYTPAPTNGNTGARAGASTDTSDPFLPDFPDD